MQLDLTLLAHDIFQDNLRVGWWDDFPVRMDRHNIATMLAVTELAEGVEGVRKDLMDDHLPQYKMLHVEMADCAIRLLDLAGAYEMDLHFDIMEEVVQAVVDEGTNPIERLRAVAVDILDPSWEAEGQVHNGLYTLFVVAASLQVNLLLIIADKRAYNATRADHKRENRSKVHGKKW